MPLALFMLSFMTLLLLFTCSSLLYSKATPEPIMEQFFL